MACRVAICDDVASYRALLSVLLEADPAIEVVGEAGDGVQAVELVRRRAPDVLLLDVSMPRMDGLEALPLVQEARPSLGVIILTGLTNPELRRSIEGRSAVRWLEKGSAPDEIIDAVRELCSESDAG